MAIELHSVFFFFFFHLIPKTTENNRETSDLIFCFQSLPARRGSFVRFRVRSWRLRLSKLPTVNSFRFSLPSHLYSCPFQIAPYFVLQLLTENRCIYDMIFIALAIILVYSFFFGVLSGLCFAMTLSCDRRAMSLSD